MPLTGCCMSMQARLWQVGKLMPHKLAKHMEVSTLLLLAGEHSENDTIDCTTRAGQ